MRGMNVIKIFDSTLPTYAYNILDRFGSIHFFLISTKRELFQGWTADRINLIVLFWQIGNVKFGSHFKVNRGLLASALRLNIYSIIFLQ